jgi:hypothetical protein
MHRYYNAFFTFVLAIQSIKKASDISIQICRNKTNKDSVLSVLDQLHVSKTIAVVAMVKTLYLFSPDMTKKFMKKLILEL